MVKVASRPCILPPSGKKCGSLFNKERDQTCTPPPCFTADARPKFARAGHCRGCETLSATYVPTDLCAAWCYAHGNPVQEGELALEGLTQMEGTTLGEYLHHLSLSFGHAFNQSLEGVTFPSCLQSLTFGHHFNRSLAKSHLAIGLQSLIFGRGFIRAWKG